MILNTVVKVSKLLSINQMVLLVSSFVFGVLYTLSSELVMGVSLVGSLLILTGISQYFKKKEEYVKCAYIVTYTQLTIIITFGIISQNFAPTLPLVCAALALTGLYYNLKLYINQWVFTGVVIIITLFFKDWVYGSIDNGDLARHLIGFFFILLFEYFLVKWGNMFMANAKKNEESLKSLLVQVETKMEENEKSSKLLQEVFDEVKARSNNLENTSRSMLEISNFLNEASANQAQIIEQISSQSAQMEDEAISAQKEAKNSQSNAILSVEKLEENNELMKDILSAVMKIEDSSTKIIGIIESIENIAFQTNILALNASIEAARVGAAGRGFAVVAEEVRTLASHSSKAANDSAQLVNESVENVKIGVSLVKKAVTNMGDVIEFSKSAASSAAAISDVMGAQVDKNYQIASKVQDFGEDIAKTRQTAEQNTSIANEITSELSYINNAIRKEV